jgi:hypothetical protein
MYAHAVGGKVCSNQVRPQRQTQDTRYVLSVYDNGAGLYSRVFLCEHKSMCPRRHPRDTITERDRREKKINSRNEERF